MNGYANVPVNNEKSGPMKSEPGTVKAIIMDAATTLERVNHALDVVFSFIAEPGMDMDTPPRNYGDCLISTAITTNEIANELEAKVERICKALGV